MLTCESYCLVIVTFDIIKHPILGSVCVCVCVCVWLGSFVNTSSGEGIVALYAAPNPFLLNKICLNQGSKLRSIFHTIIFNFLPSVLQHTIEESLLPGEKTVHNKINLNHSDTMVINTGTHHCWVDRGSVEWRLPNTSTHNQRLELKPKPCNFKSGCSIH